MPSSTIRPAAAPGGISVYYITRNTLYLTCKGRSTTQAETILPLLTGAARYALTKRLDEKGTQLRRVQRCRGFWNREDGADGRISGGKPDGRRDAALYPL